jgi:selenocysteine lyase/cysteine desulfurase
MINNRRRDFPLLDRWVYLKMGAVGPMPRTVSQAGDRFDRRRNQEEGDLLPEWLDQVEEARRRAAAYLRANPDEIALTTCTTDGINILAWGLELGPGDSVLTDELDFTGNHIAWRAAAKARGFEVKLVPEVSEVPPGTRVVSVSMVSWRNGFVHDLRSLAQLAHDRGAILVVDACQAAGALDIDVRALDVDALTFGTYKWLCGPLGVGVFYLRQSLLEGVRPTRCGWLQTETEDRSRGAKRFEYATMSFRGIAELAAAFEYMDAIGMPAIERRLRELIQTLRSQLQSRGKRFLCPAERQGPILAYEEARSEELERRCREQGILIRARPGVVKLSPHFLTDDAEVERLIRVSRNKSGHPLRM